MSLFNFMQQPDLTEGLKRFHATDGAVLLDVRSPEEYADGHLPGSVNLPLNRLAAIDLDKRTPLFVYCLSGARSARACAWLEKNGYAAENIGGLVSYHGKLVG
jgi:phage shock protein E